MSASRKERVLAWGVHLYTATGIPIALAAIAATLAGDHRAAFLWMVLALAIDATDGTLARRLRVKEVVPEFDGARLDDIVDYLNFTFVPVFFAVHTGMLPASLQGAVAAFVLVASAYGFGQTQAKTTDYFFIGFPSYWNIVVFYLYGLGLAPEWNALVLGGLGVLVFVPIAYVYPSRTPFLLPLTVALGVAWSVLLTVAIVQWPPSSTVLWVSLLYPAYYFALSLYLDARRRVSTGA